MKFVIKNDSKTLDIYLYDFRSKIFIDLIMSRKIYLLIPVAILFFFNCSNDIETEYVRDSWSYFRASRARS